MRRLVKKYSRESMSEIVPSCFLTIYYDDDEYSFQEGQIFAQAYWAKGIIYFDCSGQTGIKSAKLVTAQYLTQSYSPTINILFSQQITNGSDSEKFLNYSSTNFMTAIVTKDTGYPLGWVSEITLSAAAISYLSNNNNVMISVVTYGDIAAATDVKLQLIK